jgi:type III pantothenate kinase
VQTIAIDIGNSSTAYGLCSGKRVTNVSHVKGGLSSRAAVREAIRILAANRRLDGAVLCSVVPKAVARWEAGIKDALGEAPLVVTHQVAVGVEISYPKPASIGPDRLANACAASARYGSPVIVADFGTALTFDIVNARGQYVGGVIAPGLPLMSDYLADRTALLPHIELRGMCAQVGKSTESAMRIGAHIGYRGIVREIVNYLREKPDLAGASLCATGGFARWALNGLDMDFHFDPNLTLRGLGKIFELNRGGGS